MFFHNKSETEKRGKKPVAYNRGVVFFAPLPGVTIIVMVSLCSTVFGIIALSVWATAETV